MKRSVTAFTLIGGLICSLMISAATGAAGAATPSISGVVKAADTGLPIAGCEVLARDAVEYWVVVGSAVTGPDGAYRIPDGVDSIDPLPGDTDLQVFAIPNYDTHKMYLEQYYRLKELGQRPDVLRLAAGEARTGIDFALGRAPDNSLTGTVRDAAGAPISRFNGQELYAVIMSSHLSFWWQLPVADNGAFAFHYLPVADDYLVTVDTLRPDGCDITFYYDIEPGGTIGVDAPWRSAFRERDATFIPVGAATALSGIDLIIDPNQPRTVSGQARDEATGAPLVGYYVNIWDETIDYHAGRYTDANGQYQICAVPATDGLVANIDPPEGDYTYFTHYYDGKPDEQTANRIFTLAADAVGIDFPLRKSPVNSISGQARDTDGNPVAGQYVQCYSETLGTGRSAVTDAGGYFSAGGLSPAADYRVWTYAAVNGQDYDIYYYSAVRSVINPDDATTLDMKETSVFTGIDLIIGVQGETIAGVARDTSGAPIPGITVHAWSDGLGVGASAITDTDGGYVIWGLRPATSPGYYYTVSAWSHIHARQFYSNAASVETATPAPTGATGIDFSLSTGVSLSGTVKNTSGTPLAGAEVTAWSPVTLAWESAYADDAGRYRMDNLSPQPDYRVSAYMDGYRRIWHDGQSHESAADPVDMTLGPRVIDFVMDRGAMVQGHVYLGSAIQPVAAGAGVEVWSESARTGGWTETGENGLFRIIGLDPAISDYILIAHPAGYPSVVYAQGKEGNVAIAWESATPIAPSDIAYRDMTLPPPVSISGLVTRDGAPVAGAKVTAKSEVRDPATDALIYFGQGEAFTTGLMTSGANYIIQGMPAPPMDPNTGQAISAPVKIVMIPPVSLAGYGSQTHSVNLAGQGLTGVDFELAQMPGRTIGGTIYNLPQGAAVRIHAASAAIGIAASAELRGTGAPLTYQLAGLAPASDYVTQLEADYLPVIYYNGKWGWQSPDPVDLSAGSATGVHFTLPSESDLRSISGAVAFPDGAAAGDWARIEVFSPATGIYRDATTRVTYDSGPTVPYLIRGLPPGNDYLVLVGNPDCRPVYYGGAATDTEATPLDLTAASATDIDFTLTIGATIAGRLTLDGSPLSGVPIHAYSDETGTGASTTSGADGAYVIRGLSPAADFVVAAHCDSAGLGSFYYSSTGATRDWDSATRVSLAEASATVNATVNATGIDIAMSRGLSITGRVTDIGGLSLPGVWVSAWSDVHNSGNGAYTGPDGAFDIRGLGDGRHLVTAEPHWSTIHLPTSREDVAAGDTGVMLTLPKKSSAWFVAGTVMADGIPADGAQIALIRQSTGDYVGWATTGGNGAFRIDGVMAGVYTLSIQPAAGSDRALYIRENMTVSGDAQLGQIQLTAARAVSGAVTAADGTPMAMVRVIAAANDFPYWEDIRTNARGEFTFANPPAAGEITLTAEKSGYVAATRVLALPATDPVSFTLFTGGAISGRVRDASGAAMADVLARVETPGAIGRPGFGGAAWTDQNGRYRLEGLRSTDAAGNAIADYQVTVDAFTRYLEDGASIRYRQSVKSGKRVGDVVDFILARASEASGDAIAGTVSNPGALGGDYVAVDIFRGVDGAAVFQQHLLLDDHNGFRFTDIIAGATYYLGFGAYVGEEETATSYQWAGECPGCGHDIGLADTAEHQPPAGVRTYSPGVAPFQFQFDTSLRRAIPNGLSGPGPVTRLAPRSTVLNLARTPSEAVSSAPRMTVTWQPAAAGAEEKYYFLFNKKADYQINKRNAPTPASTARVSTSGDLSGDSVTWYFHVAAEDNRGRIGQTSSLTFAVDTVAPRNIQIRASRSAAAVGSGVIQLEMGATGATEMYISNTGFGEGGQWEKFAASRQWTLPAGGPDTATVYVQFRDAARNAAGAVVAVSRAGLPTLSDALAILRALCGIEAIIDLDRLDITRDGVVGLADVMLILRSTAGLR